MTKVLFVSDSHGSLEEINQVRNQVDVDLMIHCGDSELELDVKELESFVKVKGNCDFDSRFPNEQILEIDEINFFVTHGHLYQVKSGLTTISYRAEELQANVIVFGHTHVAGVWKMGNQLFINPGSLRLPRRIAEKTYAVMEWDQLDDISVKFYTVEGKLLEELTYQTTLS